MARPSIRKWFGLVFISACLIVHSQTANASDKKGLRFSAVGEKIQVNYFSDLSINGRDVFTDDSTEILWFGQFHLFHRLNNEQLKVEWIKPDGTLYREHSYTPAPVHAPHTWAKLDIKGADAEAFKIKGEWTVRVSTKNELIDEKKFWIGYPQY